MATHRSLALILAACLCAAAACSRDGKSNEDQPVIRSVRGDDTALVNIRAATRALAEPEPTVDYVAAQMEGVIKARTKTHALMHYEGYRVTLTTLSDRVTRITFDLVEAKPSIEQLTDELGTPREVPKGAIYEYASEVTGATIHVLAEPESLPAEPQSLVRRILIEGRSHR